MHHTFSNPLRPKNQNSKDLYPYYAGFSEQFVEDAISWLNLKDGLILDPWVGAGTTTRIASKYGINSIGFDLNPVMVLVARANQLNIKDYFDIIISAKEIIFKYRKNKKNKNPLNIFFDENTSNIITSIADNIFVSFTEKNNCQTDNQYINKITPLGCLLFVALFNVTRKILSPLNTSNPTWIKKPKTNEEKISTSRKNIESHFNIELNSLINLLEFNKIEKKENFISNILLGDSKNINLESNSVDGIISSPPYCTRLDYGRSTMPELLILQSIGLADYEDSRINLMGSSLTQSIEFQSTPKSWGKTCTSLLEKIYSHPSKASQTYYYKYHIKYFSDISASILELSRVLRVGGKACIVVQDSFYKDIHNDLPKIFTEMCEINGLIKINEIEFVKKRSMSLINTASKIYGYKNSPIESIIQLRREN